jgi:hypothetical protein
MSELDSRVDEANQDHLLRTYDGSIKLLLHWCNS